MLLRLLFSVSFHRFDVFAAICIAILFVVTGIGGCFVFVLHLCPLLFCSLDDFADNVCFGFDVLLLNLCFVLAVVPSCFFVFVGMPTLGAAQYQKTIELDGSGGLTSAESELGIVVNADRHCTVN